MMPFTQAEHDAATEKGGVGLLMALALVAVVLILAVVA